jgi:hypothetical protein
MPSAQAVRLLTEVSVVNNRSLPRKPSALNDGRGRRPRCGSADNLRPATCQHRHRWPRHKASLDYLRAVRREQPRLFRLSYMLALISDPALRACVLSNWQEEEVVDLDLADRLAHLIRTETFRAYSDDPDLEAAVVKFVAEVLR